ncbi:DUF871 domain-containing protein [Thermobrachium celere]|uniref:DUF871 domain-containing protein n=1 Tax=Thermobrachium celere TaxID=53422 RepID=UPI001944EE9A|nr:MupG family TIM beta-alpha barrel fold protein [Thermobrachium celere]GFR36440.1 hypothetical protein TCEA9_22520 [Thermobrachium celere]
MSKGISVYLGLGYSVEQLIEYINKAGHFGFTKVFTSLHIPEANYKNFMTELRLVLNECKRNNMDVSVDISPNTLKFLNLDLESLLKLKDMGINRIRVDFGFTDREIALLSKMYDDLIIEINASTITEEFLNNLNKYDANFKNINAFHNYYPRQNTGLSIETFNKKNKILKEHGIGISAFIPSNINKRGPIYEGLPTLEMHRFKKPHIAAKHLFALGVDNIYFGDFIPSDEELKTVGEVDEDILVLRLETLNNSKLENKILFDYIHQNRLDEAQDVIRSTVYRDTQQSIEANNNINREYGSVTIDNKYYLRYSGELQICKRNLPKDDRVNVVSKVIEEELFLIDYIKEGTRFRFIK